jgi:ubiquinol-cytochrome c reductase cytochrome b subunit
VLDRRVPRTAWYQADGAALAALLGVLVATGMCMTPTYAPTPERAYESIEYLTHEQLLGWFIRGLHYWAAGLMVLMLFVHLFRLILVGGYKFPREGTWLVGVVLFYLVLTMAFTGYILRWDERAIYALRVAMNMMWRVPLIGDELVVFIQGGEWIGERTLTRVYAVHVIFVPALLVSLVGWHLYLVMLRGVTSRAERGQPIRTLEEHQQVYKAAEQSERDGEPFHPVTTARTGAMGLAVVMAAAGLAVVDGPGQLQPQASLVAPAFPAEEWYFWWYSGLIALLPGWVAPWFVLVFPLVVLVVLVSLPFVDRSPYRGIRRRPLAAASVIVLAGAMLYLTDLRRRSPWTGWPDAIPPPVPATAELSRDAQRGRTLFAVHGCTSCHAVAGHGRQVGPDLARLDPPRSARHLRAYILQPPPGVQMPAYRHILSEQDLDQIVAFVLVAQTFASEKDTE